MQRQHYTPVIFPSMIAAAVAACFPIAVLALPVDPNVTNGTATFSQTGNVLTVTNSNQAIINWKSFSIGNGETTRFVQPSANSSVLNRVLSSDPSVLLGNLQSNGRVFLINPAGILVGQGAKIDVAGFVASTLSLSDGDYLNNRLRFTDTPGAGKVQNAGEITSASGGSIYLVAPQVENSGIIKAPNGEVLLAAGQRVELIDTASPGVRVEIVGSEGAATNLGSITAEAGRIGIAGVLVKNSGTLNANSLVNEGGRIFLKASNDTVVDGSSQITATGNSGGRIEILGNKVSLVDNAQIDASGQNGGGTVLVGGDYQGKNAAIQNAQTTNFGKDATIKADAIDKGDGGKVVVWADDTTTAYGNISARGGANGGDGGSVEVSGKQLLVYRGFTDTRAPFGKTGTLLLDPNSIALNPTGTTIGNISGSTVYSDDLQNFLSGSNVILQTGSGGTGNITFVSGTYNLTNATTNSLTLLAYTNNGSSNGNIDLPTGTNITMTSGASLNMVAGWDGGSTTSPTTMAYFDNNHGYINSASGSTINIFGGWLKLKTSGDITMSGTQRASNVDISSKGDITYHTSDAATTHISALTSTANKSITIIGDAGSGKIALGTLTTAAGTGSVSVSSQSSILDDNGSSNNISSGSGGITLTASNGAVSSSELAISVDLESTGSVTASAGGSYGGIRANWTNAVTGPSSVNLQDTSSSSSDINYSSAGNITTNVLTINSTNGGIQVGANGNLTYNGGTLNANLAYPIVLAASGNMSFSANLAASNSLELYAGGTLANAGRPISSASGSVTLAASTVDLTAGVTGQTGVDIYGNTVNINSVQVEATTGDAAVYAGVLNMPSGGGSLKAPAGDAYVVASDINLSGGLIQAGNNIYISADNDIRLNNGSIVDAGNIGYLNLYGGSSTLFLNDTAAMSPSYIKAGSGIELYFGGRSFGGVVIDGIETTTTGTSGFFVPYPTAAVLGSTLNITYGLQDNPVSDQLASSLGSATDSSSVGLSDDTSPDTAVTAGSSSNGTNSTGTQSGDSSSSDNGSFGESDSSSSSQQGQPNAKTPKKKMPQCTA